MNSFNTIKPVLFQGLIHPKSRHWSVCDNKEEKKSKKIVEESDKTHVAIGKRKKPISYFSADKKFDFCTGEVKRNLRLTLSEITMARNLN